MNCGLKIHNSYILSRRDINMKNKKSVGLLITILVIQSLISGCIQQQEPSVLITVGVEQAGPPHTVGVVIQHAGRTIEVWPINGGGGHVFHVQYGDTFGLTAEDGNFQYYCDNSRTDCPILSTDRTYSFTATSDMTIRADFVEG